MSLVLTLPKPDVDLQPWTACGRHGWERLGERARLLRDRAGGAEVVTRLEVDARVVLASGNVALLNARCADPRFLRAVLTTWHLDEAVRSTTLTPATLACLPRGPALSRLATVVLASLFLGHFDHLGGECDGLFSDLRDRLREAVAAQRRSRRHDVVEALRLHDALLELDGPRRLAERLVAEGADLSTWLQENGLSTHSNSRFGRLARDAVYLVAIERADPTREHDFLRAITEEALYWQKADVAGERRYFGHQVLTSLTDKSTLRPSLAWVQAMLAIGGDPRLVQTRLWRTWWSHVPEANRHRATQWMRGVDLHAFLDGVEAYARATANQPMLRMLERRKHLLVGLYEQGLVEDVRLVLGRDIRRWVLSSTPVDLVDVATLREGGMQDTAIVYVHCGGFSLVEGSHNFKLHAYVGGPLPRLADRRRSRFDASDLRDTLPALHCDVHGPGSHLAVAHQGGEWIRRALDFLRDRGIRLDERGLVTAADYADLHRRRAGWY